MTTTHHDTKKISFRSKLVVGGLLSAGILLAAVFVWYRVSINTVEGFYAIHAETNNVTAAEPSSVWEVRVREYDSTKVLRVAEQLVREAVEQGKLPTMKRRRFLVKIYAAADTAALTQEQIADMQYTNPGVTDPQRLFQRVRNGYVVSAIFPAGSQVPVKSEINRQSFVIVR